MDEKTAKAVLATVLPRLKPSAEEREHDSKLAKQLIGEINKLGYEAVLVGSRGRDTFISGDRDLDIFMFFPKNTPREKLEKEGLSVGTRVLRRHHPTTHYAEHPYSKAVVEGVTVEIVPCYKLEKGEKIISAVDRTPLHNEWVREHIRGKEDDVRLLKQFMKCRDIYGADQRVNGFSGLLCELLVIHYNGFLKVLEAASSWKQKTVIDIEKHGRDIKKFPEPLVVIDPVDPDRNAASAVSRTALSTFILHSRDFLKNPKQDAFFQKRQKVDLKRAITGRLLAGIVMPAPNVIGEILWSQLDRLRSQVKQHLIQNEFQVLRSSHWTDEKKCVLIFELAYAELSQYRRHTGPEVWDAENVEKFIEKNPDHWWVEKSNIYSWKPRAYTNAIEALRGMLKVTLQLPSHLQEPSKKAQLLVGTKLLHEKEALEAHVRK
ncbi:CCA tRNA nucleotidyltransferase [Candidatus Micrarchaeota archaeon]|nr:CCA tRNA nucleotidyltransferase [Candidatus Micrarchaeota archaeon]